MKTNKVTETVGKLMDLGKKNSPAILCGTAIVGVLATAYCAYKAGPKAEKIISGHKKLIEEGTTGKKEDEEMDRRYRREVVTGALKDLIPVMAPTVIMGTATIGCIIGSQSINARRIALLSTAYSISETAVKELNGKMEEMLGEKKTRSIKDAIIKDKLEKGEKPADNQIILTGHGDVLCKDLYSGRYFRSNAQRIGQAINQLSHDVMTDMYVSLNDFYELIELPQIPMGNDLGWNVDDCVRGQLPITFTAILTEDQQPCLCIDYDARLRADFRNLH